MAYFRLSGTSNESTVWELLLDLPKTDVSEIVIYFTKNVYVITMSYSRNPKLPSGVNVFIIKCSIKSGTTWPKLFEGWITLFTG